MVKFGKYFIFTLMSYLVKQNRKCKIEKKTYLFVNTGQIGDLVVSSVILENDKLFKNCDCYLLVDDKYSELYLYYKGNIKIITFNKIKYKYSLYYRLILLEKLKFLKITESYNITAARGFINEELTLLSGAQYFFSTCNSHEYLGDFAGRRFDKKYNDILFKDTENEYDKTLKLICSITKAAESEITIKNNKTFNINSYIYRNNKYITISPFASNLIKNWGDENYRYITKEISKQISVILLCSKNQEKRLKHLLKGIENISIFVGSLKEVSKVIYNSKLFIGNDSGLTHIAYRLGIPLITIIGGGGYGKFFPYERLNESSNDYFYKLDCFGCNWKCIYKEPYCITKIQKEVVLDKILNILKLN